MAQLLISFYGGAWRSRQFPSGQIGAVFLDALRSVVAFVFELTDNLTVW
jgi:hypothetical protein